MVFMFLNIRLKIYITNIRVINRYHFIIMFNNFIIKFTKNLQPLSKILITRARF